MKLFDQKLGLKLLILLLRPVANFCVRRGLKLQDLIEAAKVAMVTAAKSDASRNQQKVNSSRISLMTGVHRRDIVRIENSSGERDYEKDLVTKVIGTWRTDPQYTTKDKSPRILSSEGLESQFYKLVNKVSKDVNPGAVLFELDRLNAIEHTRNGIKLIVESHVPKGDPESGFKIYSKDATDLEKAVESNVLDEEEMPHFHARTEFDKVRPEAADELKRWFLKEGHLFHKKVREIVSKHDQDINPDPKFKGDFQRVVFGSFSFIDQAKKKG